MVALPPEIVFHIGAHKTATSHLQNCLQGAAADLARVGVRYLGPDFLRAAGQTVPVVFGLRAGAVLPGDLLAPPIRRLVLSEENYIGALNTPRRMPVVRRYPDAALRLTALAQAAGVPVDVHLGIRRPTAFLNAAYCQQLMGGRVGAFARFRVINPVASVDWADLVARLRAAPGVGQVVVWCHEDYAAHFAQITAGLLGEQAATCVAPLARRIHASLSAAAVAEVLHRETARNPGEAGIAARRLLPVEDGFPPFDGFAPDDHAAADACYRDQIATIGAMPGVMLFAPLWADGAGRA